MTFPFSILFFPCSLNVHVFFLVHLFPSSSDYGGGGGGGDNAMEGEDAITDLLLLFFFFLCWTVLATFVQGCFSFHSCYVIIGHTFFLFSVTAGLAL